jgi:hypothetical protein
VRPLCRVYAESGPVGEPLLGGAREGIALRRSGDSSFCRSANLSRL